MAELTEQIRLYEPHRRQPRIAAIGGGHGLSAMLRGLKTYTKNITAIVTVADDGGGSGMLREDLGMLPPGDIRNCIMALANTEPTMQQLLNYRFTDGSLAGQSFGNLFLAAMNGISGSFDEAVHRMGDVLAITGRVLPVTNQDVRLEAEFHDGSRVLGESKIFYAKKINNSRIRKVRLVPERPAALPESVQAIRDADIVVIGPGSLYTSIIPNFLVSGISDAVRQSRACKIYALNIMTQDGETDGYDADDHVRAILEHAGPGVIDVCIANSTPVPPEIMEPYAKEGVAQLELNRTDIEQLGIAVRTFPLLEPGRYIRHNSDARARDPVRVAGIQKEITTERNGAVMSFSSNVKQELCRLPISRRQEAAAELYGILLYCNAFTAELIRITTESRDLADRLPRLMKKVAGFSFDQEPEAEETGKLVFTVDSQEKIHKIFAHSVCPRRRM